MRVVLFILLAVLISACNHYSALIPVSGEQSISVVMDNNYPPYAFIDNDGELQGILIDRWKLWEQKTGIHVNITGLDWSTALQRMQAGEFDVIDTLFQTEERKQLYEFSPPFETIDVDIYFNNSITGIVDLKSIEPFTVAVKAGDAAVELLRTQGITNLIEYPSYQSIIQAVAENKVAVFIMDEPPADFLLYRYHLENEFNHTEPLYSGQFHRAVLKGNSEMLALVEAGFSKISNAEYKIIDRKWYGSTVDTQTMLKFVLIIAAVTALVFLILILWNRSLHTQVKKKTEVLLENEQKFRQIFEFSALGMSVINHQGCFLSGNSSIVTTLGYTKEEYATLSLCDIIHPDERERCQNFIRDLWAGLVDSTTSEKKYRHKDGHYVWGSVTTSLVRDVAGKPLFVLEMFKDITEEMYTSLVRDSIFRISQAAISSKSLDELYQSIHQVLGEVLPVQNFFIALSDSETGMIHFPFFVDEYESSAEPIRPGKSLTDYVMHTGMPILVDEAGFDTLCKENQVELIGAKPVEWLGVPLIVNNQPIGIVASQSYSPEIHFEQKDVDFLGFVSNQIAQCIELKRAEEDRLQSELRFRYLFENSPVSIWEEDFSLVKQRLEELRTSGVQDFKSYFTENPEELAKCVSTIKILDVNKQALKLAHAKSKNDLFSRLNTVIDVHHPFDFMQEILNVAEGKLEFEWETIHRTVDSTPIFVSMHWAVAEGHEKNLSRVIISLIDLSLSKKAEAALLASEERYRNLVDNIGEGIVIVDAKMRFLFANSSANKIFGITQGNLVNSRLFDFVKAEHQGLINKKIGALKAGESTTIEMEIIKQDGEHCFVQIFARPQFDPDRHFTGTFGIIHDITDRKKAEEKRILRSRFEEMLTNISTRFINIENEDIDNEINIVLRHVGQFEDVDRTYVFRIDPRNKLMSNTHEWCREGIAPKIHDMQNRKEDDFPWFVDQITCDPLIVSDINTLPVNASNEKRLFKKHSIKSIANFPMWVDLELVGFVGFDSVRHIHEWDGDHCIMLQQFANIISNAIERSRLTKILEDRAIRDELTNVYNRRGFLQCANNELTRAYRYHHSLGLILLDMDHLKWINDTHGHAAGDLALIEIAKLCQKNIRENDILGRWGGDEFVILLPESNREFTLNVATRLHRSINEHSILIGGDKIPLTISAGVALAEKQAFTVDELFKNADAALYQAKEAGRNRIVLYGQTQEKAIPH